MRRTTWPPTCARRQRCSAEHTLHFHFVHQKDGSPIGYQKICKAEGKPVPDDEIVEIHPAAETEEEGPVDLLHALRASVERSARGRGRSKSSSRDRPDGALERLPKSELQKRARAARIDGRSRMSKDELVDALRAAA